jgi:hypothetical protein
MWARRAPSENVRLMRCPSTQFRGHRSVESDSHKTFEFSARKSCVTKRMRIRGESSRGSQQQEVVDKLRRERNEAQAAMPSPEKPKG